MSVTAVKILLVEDSPSDAALLQESLSERGDGEFDFTLAESWKEAEARLRDQPFDMLLLDLSLPDITGRDTFIRARRSEEHTSELQSLRHLVCRLLLEKT